MDNRGGMADHNERHNLTTKKGRKKLFYFFLYNIGILVFLLTLCEILVRLWIPEIQPQGTEKNLYQENRYGESHGLKPLSRGLSNGALVQVDRYGFRETSVKLDTSKNSWLLLGDSVTMGIGVEADSTFAGILQAELDSVNILNSSMIGYNVQNYGNVFSYFINHRRNDLKIKRVVLFWCLNDLYTDSDAVQMPGGRLRSRFGGLLNFIRVHSRFYFFLKTLLFDRPKSYYLFDSRLYADGGFQDEDGNQGILNIQKTCSDENIRFDVVLLPYEYQLRHKDVDLDKPQKVMTQKLKACGIHVLDPMPYLLDSGIKSKELYLYGDGIHLSKSGHRAVAYFLLAKWNIQ
jgi:hypothetical protein